jgi:hypothetical protein
LQLQKFQTEAESEWFRFTLIMRTISRAVWIDALENDVIIGNPIARGQPFADLKGELVIRQVLPHVVPSARKFGYRDPSSHSANPTSLSVFSPS